MLKPPPLFRPLESLKVAATPRMLRAVVLVLLTVLIPTSAERLLSRPAPLPPPPPAPLPVPSMDWTTDGASAAPFFLHAVLGGLPSPGPNQKRAGQCRSERSEVEKNGGCWVKTHHPKPCPEGFQWEDDDGSCWIPVAYAKPTPTSGGGPFPVNVAGEE